MGDDPSQAARLDGPGETSPVEVHPFDLPPPPPHRPVAGETAAADLLVAVFGGLLARHQARSSVDLCVAGARSAAPPRRIELSITNGITARDVVSQVTRQLAETDPRREPDRPTTELHSAVVSFSPLTRATDPGAGAARPAVSPGGLHLVVEPSGDGHRASLHYDGSRFSRAAIERLAGHLAVLLESAPDQLDTPFVHLPLLTAAERSWLETFSRGPARDVPRELLHQQIERHASATPEAVAVRFRDESLTYGELNRQANQLARHLVARGVGAERRVVVCVAPSLHIAVVLLAILKSGGVYVPLDPGYPLRRIRTILESTKPTVVLSQRQLADRLPTDVAPVVVLEDLAASAKELSSDDLAIAIDRLQTASIYFTSGTTGAPKGAMASHANLVSYIDVAQARYRYDQRDVIPAIARFSFSISMFELASPLAAGGTLLVLDRDHVLDVPRLARTLAGVTCFHMGPSLLRGVVAHLQKNGPGAETFAGVRHASSGGDMIPPELLEAMKTVFSRAEIFVIYGCTEISCMGCTYPVPRDRTVTTTFVGRPFENTTVRVLDDAFAMVPAGVVGEIWFAGGGVVEGYLDRPELTAERFVELGGERFYRTGDVGRISDDGWLEMLGRNDFQIQVRGMRVELGEVEHTLRAAPGVRDGLVVSRMVNEEKSLVAYVVTEHSAAGGGEDGQAARTGAIRRHMADTLPDYMVPSAYVELAALPLNDNMKVDRNALLAPAGPLATAPGRPPETATEKHLAALWRQLLRTSSVGLDDNFFELGGDSLQAMELIVAVEATFGVVLEGMDVLRESLETHAALVDRHAGRPPAARSRSPRAVAPSTADPFYFGRDASLYGVFHPAAGGDGSQAVLICGPVGHEQVRAHFVLRRLAASLASRGVAALRFDYFGSGDSLGDSRDASCARWQSDIVEAGEELRRRAPGARITLVGARLGATLAHQLRGRLPLEKMIFWDPVRDGAEYCLQLTRNDREYRRSVRDLVLFPRRPSRPGQLLASTFSESTVAELRQLTIGPPSIDGRPPVRWLETAGRTAIGISRDEKGVTRRRAVEQLDLDARWSDLSRLEDILPDRGITRALTTMILEAP